ncbi:hypothetical protein NL533_33700, partial [Klebsiella pneumoniae]|nr:hypothetical protein [Klebsiella pneumoniae]
GPKPPQVIVAQGLKAQVQTLPAASGQTVVNRIAAAWPALTVTGTDYSKPTVAPDPAVRWSSRDGGKTFALAGPG